MGCTHTHFYTEIEGENRLIGLDMYLYKILTAFKKIALQTVWQEDKQRKETERREEKGKERKMSVKWAAYTHTLLHRN